MASTRRIGILTGGGDVPGLNPVIKSVVYRSTELGYEVIGMVRRSSTVNFERIGHLQENPRLQLVPGDLLDEVSLIDVLRTHRPNEVFNLAAQSGRQVPGFPLGVGPATPVLAPGRSSGRQPGKGLVQDLVVAPVDGRSDGVRHGRQPRRCGLL